MPKRIFDMNPTELLEFVEEQRRKVRSLRHETPGSSEYRYERSILHDAEQLLAKKTAEKTEPTY